MTTSGQFRADASTAPPLLAFILALAHLFEDGEPGFFGVGHRKFLGRIKSGKEFAHGLLAGRAVGKLLGIERAPQGEFTTAHRATAVAKFVFVDGHASQPTIHQAGWEVTDNYRRTSM